MYFAKQVTSLETQQLLCLYIHEEAVEAVLLLLE